MLSTLIEIVRDGRICMLPSAYSVYRDRILNNIDFRIHEDVRKEDKMQSLVVFGKDNELASVPTSTKDFMGDAEYISRYKELEEGDRIVNIVRITGVMTRGGGDCSYGSIDIRDRLIRAANFEHCVGHILYTRTVGGMASTLRDYRKAINYCHEKGQRVFMYCDGDVASAGVFLGCMCDGIYANNPEDEIGSIGMYASFFTLSDGEKNKISGEQYHEYYADASFDKNKEFRAAANGDMSVVAKEVNRDLSQLLLNLKSDRPRVQKEQMSGSMFKQGMVKGSLVDDFCSMSDLARLILDDYDKRKGTPLPLKEGISQKMMNTAMTKTYVNLAKLIGEEPYECDDREGLHIQTSSADALEKAIGELVDSKEDMSLKVQQAEKEVASYRAKCESLSSDSENLKNDNHDLKSKVKDLEKSNTEMEQELSDLREELKELHQASTEGRKGGESPKNNGTSSAQPRLKVGYVYDPTKSPAENARCKEKHLKEMEKLAFSKR